MARPMATRNPNGMQKTNESPSAQPAILREVLARASSCHESARVLDPYGLPVAA